MGSTAGGPITLRNPDAAAGPRNEDEEYQAAIQASMHDLPSAANGAVRALYVCPCGKCGAWLRVFTRHRVH